jgi:hypothetical protein
MWSRLPNFKAERIIFSLLGGKADISRTAQETIDPRMARKLHDKRSDQSIPLGRSPRLFVNGFPLFG